MIQNKKRIISLILMLTLLVSALVVGAVTASAADNVSDFGTIGANTSYNTKKSTNGWVGTNCASVKVGSHMSLVMNGKTSAVGSITSPTLTGGVSSITFGYANTYSESNGVSVTITVTSSSGEQSTTLSKAKADVTQNTPYSHTWELETPITGDFTIKFTNNSPSKSTSNKDRVSIFNVTWVSYTSGETPEPDAPACEHTNKVAIGEAKDATCTEAGITAGLKCADCGETITAQETISANGHDFDRTATGNGRCKKCEFVAPKATFIFAEGDNEVVYATNKESHVKAPAVADLVGSYAKEYTFAGWAKMENGIDGETTTAPTLYQSEKYITLTEDAVFYAVYTYQVVSGNASDDFILTDIENIKADDLVVITMRKSSTLYALPNNGGASSPTASNLLSVSNKKLEQTPDEFLLWNIHTVEGGYVIYVNGSTTTYLYCTNDNSGVRVGTGNNNIFTISDGYLKNNGLSRYVGVYTTKPDWRCYNSTSTNIGGQSLEFYVKSNGITTYYVTSLECNHTYESEQTQAPSCTAPGVITYTCSTCGDSYTEAIPATNHPNKTTTTVGATCTVDGSITVTCDDCGATISTETIPATGHVNTTTETVGATCTENGYTKVTCDCGHVVSNTVIPATNHPNKTTTTVGATCTVDGSITVTCDDCGATISTETIPAPGHTEIVDNAVTATCTTAGKTEGKHCSVCNEVLVAQETVDALGHSYNSVVTNPTFDAAGYTTYTCSVCNHSYVSNNVPALVAVAKIGDTRFETLQAALDAAKDGDVITLVANVQASKYLDVKTANNGEIARNFTLDLNGYNISPAVGYNYNSGYSLIFVGINQTLTIKGEGTITADKKVTVGVYGVLNLVGGTIINKGTSDEDAALCIWHWDPEVDGDDYGYVVSGTGVVTGGTIEGDVYCEEGGAKLTVNVNENITLDQALAIGGTITLTKDVDYGKEDFIIPSAVTINLNGHNITAAGVITFDTATRFVGEGKLVIPQDKIVLAGEADDIAVWVGDGYVFNQVNDQYKSEVTGDDSFNVVFRPSFGSTEHNEAILGGDIDAGLTFELQIWNGETKLFAGTINAELVKQAYANGGAISIRVKNAPAGTYTVKLVIKSSIGLINTAEFKTITIPAVEDAPAEAN